MRLLSFLTQMEAAFQMIRPEDGPGWRRRVNYQSGEASAWHPTLGIALHLRLSVVAENSHGVQARWTGPTGEVLAERTFFCGSAAYEWQAAAEAVAELAPAASLSQPAEPSPVPIAAQA